MVGLVVKGTIERLVRLVVKGSVEDLVEATVEDFLAVVVCNGKY